MYFPYCQVDSVSSTAAVVLDRFGVVTVRQLQFVLF